MGADAEPRSTYLLPVVDRAAGVAPLGQPVLQAQRPSATPAQSPHRVLSVDGGQLTEAVGLLVTAGGDTFTTGALGSAVSGAGTAMAYPTLIAAVGDVAHPTWRGTAVGVYRLWRDIGFAVGAVLAGALADLYSVAVAIAAVAAITAASGFDVAVRMRETHPRAARRPRSADGA